MFATRAPALTHTARTPLRRVPDWPTLPSSIKLHRVSMVESDSRGQVYVAHRGEHPLLCLNPDGTLARIVGDDVHQSSICYDLSEAVPVAMERLWYLHGLSIDPWDNVWVTDVGRHLVMRFNPAGQLTLTLGVDGKSGCDDKHFHQPTHAVVVPSGEIFVADGYGNSRVVKLSPEGKFLHAWGSRGTDSGQFHTPHAIAVGRDGRLHVSDRENDRVQVFDQAGTLLAIWPGLHSMDGICAAPDGQIYGSAGADSAIIQFEASGRPRQVWTDPAGGYPDRYTCRYPGGDYPHGLSVDAAGAIFIAETNWDEDRRSRVAKYLSRPG